METLLLPIAFSPETPEGFTPQETPQGLGNFAEVLEKQYFKEENPLPEDPKISLEEPASSAMAHSFLAAIWVPDGIAFPQEKSIPDQGLTDPAAKEGFQAPSLMEPSSLFIFPPSSPGAESKAGAAIINGGKTIPPPDETLTPSFPQDRAGGTLTPPVFFPSGNRERNQETGPRGEKISEKPVQGTFPILPSHSSVDQKGIPISQESPPPPDSSTSQTPSEAPLGRELAGNMEMAPERGKKTAHPVDSSAPPSPSQKTLPGESTGKIVMPPEREKTIDPSSDLPTSPVSVEESLRKELLGKIELSLGEEKKSIRPSVPQERNGSENRTAQESNDFLATSEPSLKMEENPRVGEGQAPRRQEPFSGVVKEALEAKNAQNPEESGPWVGTQAYILDSMDKESGVHFSGKAGKGQEKAFGAGADVRPLPDGEIQNRPSFFGALTDSLNRQVENGGEIKEASSSFSPRGEPSEVFQQVGQRVLWLIRHNEERIRITLDPPELGQVLLEIDRHREHIKTVLWTDNPTAKASLETSQGEIQRIIESEGFKLEKFDVFVQQDPGWFRGRKGNPGKPDSSEAGRPAAERAPSVNSTESIPGRIPASHLGSRSLDLFV